MPQLQPIDLAAEGVTVKWDYEYRTSGSPSESGFGNATPGTQRKALVTPWTKRDVFCRWVLGEVAVNWDLDPVGLTRTPPQPHPAFPGLYADSVASMVGFRPAPDRTGGLPNAGTGTTEYDIDEYDIGGSPTGVQYPVAKYESAIVTVNYAQYRFLPWGDGRATAEAMADETGRYTEVTDPKSSAEYLQLPGMVLYYTRPDQELDEGGILGPMPAGLSIPYGTGLILPQEEITVVWRRVPYEVFDPLGQGDYGSGGGWFGGSGAGANLSPLYKRIYGDPEDPDDEDKLPYLGTINKTAIFGRAAGTLMFSGVDPVRRSGPTPDTFEWDLHYKFLYDPNRGWDRKYYHPNTKDSAEAGWYYVSRTAVNYAHGSIPDKDSQYNEREFRDLWVVGDLP